MSKKILVTGGAGFIGSFLVDRLIEEGNEVTVFDNLDPQVHIGGKAPDFLNKKAEFIKADVNKNDSIKGALKDTQVIFHLASAVGVTQSMYELNYYLKNNSLATANLLEILVKEEHSVKKIIVAASMSSYGEGLYNCGECGFVEPPLRSDSQLREKKMGTTLRKMQKTLKTPSDT